MLQALGHGWMRRSAVGMLAFVILSGLLVMPAPGQDDDAKPGPKFLNLRFNEDFSYLSGEPDSYTADRSDMLKNISLGGDWSLDIGGEFRFRMENRSNAAFGLSPRTGNTQQFYRWMLHFDVSYRDVFRVFAQGIVAHAEDQDTGFNALHENHGDLQQLFFDVRPFGSGTPWLVRIGRQELLYGSERFVSPSEWVSTRVRFDAAKIVYEGEQWNVEGFYAKPVVVQRHQRDRWNEDFDFAGIYATYSGIQDHGLDLYVFAIDRTQDTINPNGRIGDQSIYTLGARFWGNDSSGFDYEAELAGQWGKWAGDTVQAWSWSIDTGYTFDIKCQPRIGAGFDWASGDEDPFDGKVGTFNQLFADGHKYFGYMDLIGRQNVNAVNVNMSAWAVPDKVKAKIAFHTFWLNADRDALYNAGGTPILRDPSGDAGEQIGHELDLTVVWDINVHSSMLVGYSHFWDNSFVHNTVFSDDDPDFFYLQYQYKF